MIKAASPPGARLARIGLLTLLSGTLTLLLLNALLGIFEKWHLLQATEERMSAFEIRLARPLPPNRFEAYSAYLTSDSDNSLATTLQSDLITLVNTRGGQVADIRELPAFTTPEGLVALRLHLVFEGDLQVVTEVLEGLARLEYPLLLDNTNIRTTSPTASPDQHLRVALDMSVWTETPP